MTVLKPKGNRTHNSAANHENNRKLMGFRNNKSDEPLKLN